MLWSPAASSSQHARVLTDVKARRFAPPPLRGADGLDAGSAHANSPDWLLPTMLTHTPPTCCGRRPVQNDALSGDRCIGSPSNPFGAPVPKRRTPGAPSTLGPGHPHRRQVHRASVGPSPAPAGGAALSGRVRRVDLLAEGLLVFALTMEFERKRQPPPPDSTPASVRARTLATVGARTAALSPVGSGSRPAPPGDPAGRRRTRTGCAVCGGGSSRARSGSPGRRDARRRRRRRRRAAAPPRAPGHPRQGAHVGFDASSRILPRRRPGGRRRLTCGSRRRPKARSSTSRSVTPLASPRGRALRGPDLVGPGGDDQLAETLARHAGSSQKA